MFGSIGRFGWWRGVYWRGPFQTFRDSCDVGFEEVQAGGIAGTGSIEVIEGLITCAKHYAELMSALEFGILAEFLTYDVIQRAALIVREG